MNRKRIFCLLLAAVLMLGLFAGCGKKNGGNETVTTQKRQNTSTYNKEPQDLGGYDLDILHVESDLWNMNTSLAPTSYTGDVISSAVFSRNEYVQDLYNCYITEHNDVTFYSMSAKISTLVASGQCTYDAAYSEGSSVNELVSQGVLQNLYSLPELQLGESWWSQIVNKDSTLGSGKYQTLYFTQSNLSLTAFDLTWCIFFNKAVQNEYDLADFYQMVREGKWTLEALYSNSKQIAAMRGDETFDYVEGGKSLYGMTTYWNGAKAMMIGAGMEFVTKNEDDELKVATFGEGYVDICNDLATLFGEPGTFTYGGNSTSGTTTGNASDYLKIFNANRALFLGAEVKSSVSDLKTFQGEFGILPMPCYTEGDSYRSWVNYLAPVLTIPNSTEDPHKAALLLDVLSYFSDQEVLPIYYDQVLRGRGTSDADSWEMLDIINETRCFDVSIAYGWSRQFVEVVSNLIFRGNGSAASVQPESYNEVIQQEIDKTMKAVFGE